MDASVHHELVQGEPRYFSAHGIEAGKHDSLRVSSTMISIPVAA